MARKTTATPYLLDGSEGITGNFESVSVMKRDFSRVSFQINLTGTVSGTITVEISNDKVNWNTVKDSDIVVSTAGGNIIEYPFPTAQYIRIKFTSSSTYGIKVYAFTSNNV
jgi:hypothetical protein